MIKQINIDRFIELLKKMQNLKNLERSLRIETPLEWEELSHYRRMLESQVAYNQCSDYLFLFQEYLNGNITMQDFFGKFYNYYFEFLDTSHSLETDLEALRLFSIDSKSDGFFRIILDIFQWLESIQEQEYLTNKPHTDDGSLQILIQECYEKIQKEYL